MGDLSLMSESLPRSFQKKIKETQKRKEKTSLLSSELQLFLWFETKHRLHADLRKYQLTSVVCIAENPKRNCGFKIVKICAF
jgi:hypothetical protein